MSVATSNAETIRTVLSGYNDDHVVADWLHKSGALNHVTQRVGVVAGGAQFSLARDTSEALSDVLDLKFVDLLVGAWATEGALLKAARATIADPQRTEMVNVVTQRISWSANPSVEIRVDEVLVDTLSFLVQLLFEITGIAAEVRGGRILSLDIGACDLTALLTVNGLKLEKRKPVHLDALLRFRLDAGIPLVATDSADTRAGAELVGRGLDDAPPVRGDRSSAEAPWR